MNLVFSSFEYPRLTAIFRHREYSTQCTPGAWPGPGGVARPRARAVRACWCAILRWNWMGCRDSG